MRDFLILSVILGALPIGIIRPYYGILVYAWVSYMYPQMYAWTFARRFPAARLAALSALTGALLVRESDTTVLKERENIVMALLLGMFTLSTYFAVYEDSAWDRWQDVSKVIVISLLTSTLLTD